MNRQNLARKLFAACVLMFGLAWGVQSQAEVPVPALSARVIDQTGTLTAEQTTALEQSLATFERKKGSQIVVLLVPTTAPENIEQYSMRVVEQWKLGRKKVDDGALLLIAKNDRALRIEVGYGLEGALTDITSKRIVSDTIAPHLSRGDFYSGITAGVAQMMRVIDGEALPEPKQQRGVKISSGFAGSLPIILILALAIGGILRTVLGPALGSLVTGGLVATGVWLVLGALSLAFVAGIMAILFTLMGGGRMGGHGMGGFGGGRGGGFGGGGFSGGGGFGGGGASGKF